MDNSYAWGTARFVVCEATRKYHISFPASKVTTLISCFLLGNSPASEFYMPTFRNTLFHLYRQVDAYEDGTDSVPKSRHIKFRHRVITQKKRYNIQNMAKVWNQEYIIVCNLLGISPASDYCWMPTFRNTLSVPSSKAGYEVWSSLHTSYPAFEDGTDRVFRNVGIQQ